jgi:hypothetical protein
MTMATFGKLLDDTQIVLARLQRRYEATWRALETSSPAVAEFALWLAGREAETIAALAGYRGDDDAAVLEIHIRLGSGFPFSADDLELPSDPTLDELVAMAERTDQLLTILGQRIRVYAAHGQLLEVLHAIDEHVDGRRRGLANALAELEAHHPSPARPSTVKASPA